MIHFVQAFIEYFLVVIIYGKKCKPVLKNCFASEMWNILNITKKKHLTFAKDLGSVIFLAVHFMFHYANDVK